jgi:hypothetical protein
MQSGQKIGVRYHQAADRTVSMPQLSQPTMHVHASFVAAMEEFQRTGQGGPGDESTTGRAIREYGSRWHE